MKKVLTLFIKLYVRVIEVIKVIVVKSKPSKVYEALPDMHDAYFILGDRNGTRKGYGGNSPCVEGKVRQFEGCALNNCVGASWGLFAKAEDNPMCKVGFIKSNLYPQSASAWWNNGKVGVGDKYERGTSPKLGSIVCFKSHVVYLNEIKDNGDLVVISSDYQTNHPYLYFKTLSVSNNYKWSDNQGSPLGYIYPKQNSRSTD